MSTNTNGFNYSSDYQGHSGSTYFIFIVIMMSIFMIGSFKNNDEPSSNSSNDDYNDSYDNNYNDSYSDYDDNNESINDSELDENINTNDNVLDNTDVHDDDSMIDHGYFEIYKP